MRLSKNFSIGTSPSFASSTALRRSSSFSPCNKAAEISEVRFLDPGRRPPFPTGNGRPRTAGVDDSLRVSAPIFLALNRDDPSEQLDLSRYFSTRANQLQKN